MGEKIAFVATLYRITKDVDGQVKIVLSVSQSEAISANVISIPEQKNLTVAVVVNE